MTVSRQSFTLRRNISSAAAAHVSGPGIYHELPVSPLPNVQPSPVAPPHSNTPRTDRFKDAEPFSHFLTDNFHRQHTYLRVSVTERCNLRCTYCMPAEGVPLSPPAHLLTTPEIVYLSELFVKEGVTKIRLTGGEPTVRKDILPLMHEIGNLRSKGLKELCLTTNGISLHRKLDAMAEAGLTGINLSLDTLDPYQFQIMTRRKGYDAVMKSLNRILDMNRLGAGIKLKLNTVIMRGVNEREIIPFVDMGKENEIEVRFIEYMPFDGNKWSRQKMLSYKEMLEVIRHKYPRISRLQEYGKNETSKTWQVPGFRGKIGFITSMTENFCGTCNRLRITSDGNLKVCLFGNNEVSLRDLLRKANHGEPIDWAAVEAMKQIEMDRRQSQAGSMGPLGYGERERELLEVIGMAVKRKKERHAGMEQLEHMKNRPMILIEAHQISIADKLPRPRAAIAIGCVRFSNPQPGSLIKKHALEKGDVLAVARVAAIMAVKNTANLIPLSHNCVAVEGCEVDLNLVGPAHQTQQTGPQFQTGLSKTGLRKADVDDWFREPLPPHGGIKIRVHVNSTGKTGVEMEALTGVVGAALTVVDMCKGVDQGLVVEGVKVVGKKGGRSGAWGVFGRGEDWKEEGEVRWDRRKIVVDLERKYHPIADEGDDRF
ncbi:MAG: hypothetical protein Q9225_003405 [Loekoesia sp. 1 TL-2023]